MKQVIAIAICSIALIFFIAAAGVPDWEHASANGQSVGKFGAFRYCVQTTCYSIYPDCTVHSSSCSGSCGTVPNPSCNQIRAVEGFLILALLFTAIVVIIMCVVRFGGKEVSAVAVHVLLAIAALCAVISFAIFANKLHPPALLAFPGLTWSLGAGFALTIVGWLLVMAAIPLWHVAHSGTTA